jgi:hypothetical protein
VQQRDGWVGRSGTGDHRAYFRAMFQKVAFALLMVLPLLSSCAKDEGVDGSSAADISFGVDTGYTYENDTVGFSDTLRVIMIAAQGTDALRTFVLSVSYDGAAALGTDTANIQVDPYFFDTHIITRAVPGVEKWSFSVLEADGDRTTRNLTFVTQ